MPRPSLAIVWFRRDLRLHDNPALTHALERFDEVVPLYVVDDRILAGRWPSANRRWFLAGALASLRDELRIRGASLGVVRGSPGLVVPAVAAELGAQAVVVGRDYGPYGRGRDAAVERALVAQGRQLVSGRGLLVHEPEEVSRADRGPFTVFSPFHRRWLEASIRAVLPAPRSLPLTTLPSASESIEAMLPDPTPDADRALLLEPSEAAARTRLARWAASDALRDYDRGRDRLDLDGTSRLSQDLRWGLLSPVEVLERCPGSAAGPTRFRAEIAWRDFYAHLLWHRPDVARRSFRVELDGVARERSPEIIEAWRAGRTGYPVVDAAMRQLLASGWMHNRARMVVASFLTKHLGVDWRIGEAHFMKHLVDGDPASNNGGWQWAASTGTDPQPFFRIFNPTLQGRRHDPEGDYVRRWIPELASTPGLDGGAIHAPPPGAYLPPIVDHLSARRQALAAYADLSPAADALGQPRRPRAARRTSTD